MHVLHVLPIIVQSGNSSRPNPKCHTHIWKQCQFKCNRPHQSMYFWWPKFKELQVRFKKIKPYFPTQMWVLQVWSKNLKHTLKLICKYYIFWQLFLEVIIVKDPIPKCNTNTWKCHLKFKKPQHPMHIYLLNQMYILHVWSKKLALFFPHNCKYCKFGPNFQCIFKNLYASISYSTSPCLKLDSCIPNPKISDFWFGFIFNTSNIIIIVGLVTFSIKSWMIVVGLVTIQLDLFKNLRPPMVVNAFQECYFMSLWTWTWTQKNICSIFHSC